MKIAWNDNDWNLFDKSVGQAFDMNLQMKISIFKTQLQASVNFHKIAKTEKSFAFSVFAKLFTRQRNEIRIINFMNSKKIKVWNTQQHSAFCI